MIYTHVLGMERPGCEARWTYWEAWGPRKKILRPTLTDKSERHGVR